MAETSLIFTANMPNKSMAEIMLREAMRKFPDAGFVTIESHMLPCGFARETGESLKLKARMNSSAILSEQFDFEVIDG